MIVILQAMLGTRSMKVKISFCSGGCKCDKCVSQYHRNTVMGM